MWRKLHDYYSSLRKKIEPLFFLDYSANMYSRKTMLHTRLWNYTQLNRNTLPEVSVFYAEYWVIQEKQGVQFFATNYSITFSAFLKLISMRKPVNTVVLCHKVFTIKTQLNLNVYDILNSCCWRDLISFACWLFPAYGSGWLLLGRGMGNFGPCFQNNFNNPCATWKNAYYIFWDS